MNFYVEQIHFGVIENVSRKIMKIFVAFNVDSGRI